MERSPEGCLEPDLLETLDGVTNDGAPDANVEAVREALLERSRVGQRTYGTTTEREDLSLLEWIQHLQEEVLDAAVYLEVLKGRVREIPTWVEAGSARMDRNAILRAADTLDRKGRGPQAERLREVVSGWNRDGHFDTAGS